MSFWLWKLEDVKLKAHKRQGSHRRAETDMLEGLKDCVVWFVSLVPAAPEAQLGLPIDNRISHFPILTRVGLTLGIMPQHESKTEREREIRTKHIMKEWNKKKKKTSTTSCFHET